MLCTSKLHNSIIGLDGLDKLISSYSLFKRPAGCPLLSQNVDEPVCKLALYKFSC